MDNSSASLLATVIGATSAILGSLLTQFISSKREGAQEKRSRQKEFFEAKKLAYSNLRVGIELHRAGNKNNEVLKSALAWIELFSPEMVRQEVKAWKGNEFLPRLTEEVLWTHIRVDLMDYYGETLPSHYLGAFEFIWKSAIFRAWLALSSVWITCAKLQISANAVLAWVIDWAVFWPFFTILIVFLVMFIFSGHTQLIYYGWWAEVSKRVKGCWAEKFKRKDKN